MAESPDDRLRDMEERSKELGREIEETEQDWEKTQREVPTAESDEEEDEEGEG